MKIFVFLFGVSLSVMHLCDSLKPVSTPFNDDIDYSQLLSDTTITELLEGSNINKTYSKFFHLDALYGFHYNFSDFIYYWANSFRKRFTFGQSYIAWRVKSIHAMRANVNGDLRQSLWEYFNFLQSFWYSSSFSLSPTYTWQIKNSNWFFSLGGIVEWSSYVYDYGFISCEKPQFSVFDVNKVDDAFKGDRNSKVLEAAYNDNRYKINKNIYNRSLGDNYQVIRYDTDVSGTSPYHFYTDVVSYSDDKNTTVNGVKKIEEVDNNDTKVLLWDERREIEYKDNKSQLKKQYINIIRGKNDIYDGRKLEHTRDNSIFYVCGNDDSLATCSILTNILRIGVVGNISWHKNKIDPLDSWHFGISLGFGPQFGYSNNGDFSFFKWHTTGFSNISIKRFLNSQFIRFDENIYEDTLILKPVFFFVQVEVAYKRITFWIRFYPPFFTDDHKKNGYTYKIVPDNNSWAKYKDFSYPMTAPDENNQDTINGRVSKTAFFSRYGFACGVKVVF